MNKASATQTAIRRERRLAPPEMGRETYMDCLVISDTGESIYDVAVWGDEDKSMDMADNAIASFLGIHNADFSPREYININGQIEADPYDPSDKESIYCLMDTDYLLSSGLVSRNRDGKLTSEMISITEAHRSGYLRSSRSFASGTSPNN